MRRPVTASRRGPGLLGTMARTAVIAGTASAVAGGMSDSRQRRADQQAAQQQLQARQTTLEQQQQQLAMQAQAASPQAANPAPARAGGLSQEAIARLSQLAELQQQGILSPDEFAQQKARILGS